MIEKMVGRASPRLNGGAEILGGTRRSLLGLLGVLLLIGLTYPASVYSQTIEARPNAAEAEAAIAQLRSPYCPGFMLEVCPSPAAEALRDSIYDLAAQGVPSDEIVEWMIANHGEEWRGLPRRSGAGLLAWVIPPLGLLVGVFAFVMWLRSSRRRKAEEPPVTTETLSDGERQKLAAAMRDWEETGYEEP